MKIVIPSYNRYEMVQKKTLALLKRQKISMKSVYLFVHPESYKEYKKIARKYGCFIIETADNIRDVRNHIINFFPEGEQIVEIDDDIDKLINFKTKKAAPLKQILTKSFKMLNGKGLFGFSSTDNEFFSSGKDKWGFYSIVGSLCGYYNDKRISLTVKEKEDFERGIQFYLLGLPILKRNNFGIKTNYWVNPGGIQSKYDLEKRKKVQLEAAIELMDLYPYLCFIKERKNGLVDIRYRTGGDPMGFDN